MIYLISLLNVIGTGKTHIMENNLHIMDVSFYDIINKKPLGTTPIGTFFSHNSKVQDGKLMVYAWTDASANPLPLFIIHPWGNQKLGFGKKK
jgi:hypothetical protein